VVVSNGRGSSTRSRTQRGVGAQIRAERARRGWSLEELAGASGLSRGWMGRIERGLAEPSLSALQRISEALGVSPSLLVEEEDPLAPSADSGVDIVRRGRRNAVRFPNSHHFWEVLTPNLRGRLQVLVVELLPGEPRPIELFSHAGEEVFFVLSGEVALEVDGRVVILSTGDSATISSIRPHRLRNVGPEKAQLLSATTPPFL